MSKKINQYLIERFSFGNEDYYDIDYWDGSAYQTAKIKGSTILAGIQAGISSLNVYNTDGTLTANRTLDGDAGNFTLNLQELRSFFLSSTGLPSPLGTPHIDIQVDPQGSGPIFRVRDTASGTDIFKILQTGQIQFNDVYTFPTSDGTADQVLATDGAGALSFVDIESGVPGKVIVQSASDLPATLLPNTVYLIVGTIITSSSITTAQNSVILGWDPLDSFLTYTGTGTFITVNNNSFTARNLTLTAVVGTLFEATNIDYTVDPLVDSFQGRNQRFQIVNTNLKGTGFNTPTGNSKIGSIEGFGTINFNANLVTGFNDGLDVSNGLSFEALNNKAVLWGQTVNSRFIDFRPNNWSGQTGLAGSYIPNGFNVVNFSGNTLHPQINETGVYWDGTLATTRLGNISGNVLITTGGGTALAGATYDDIKTINIQGNQGIADNTPYILVTMNAQGNIMNMPATNLPLDLNGQAVATNSQLLQTSNEARIRYNGIKDFYGEIMSTLSIIKSGGGTDAYTFTLWEDQGGGSGFVQLPNASYTLGSSDQGANFTITYSTVIKTGYEYEIRVTATTTDDVRVLQMQFSIKG